MFKELLVQTQCPMTYINTINISVHLRVFQESYYTVNEDEGHVCSLNMAHSRVSLFVKWTDKCTITNINYISIIFNFSAKLNIHTRGCFTAQNKAVALTQGQKAGEASSPDSLSRSSSKTSSMVLLRRDCRIGCKGRLGSRHNPD